MHTLVEMRNADTGRWMILDPTFDPNVVIRERANEILEQNIVKSLEPNNLLSGVVDLKEFAEQNANMPLDVMLDLTAGAGI